MSVVVLRPRQDFVVLLGLELLVPRELLPMYDELLSPSSLDKSSWEGAGSQIRFLPTSIGGWGMGA